MVATPDHSFRRDAWQNGQSIRTQRSVIFALVAVLFLSFFTTGLAGRSSTVHPFSTGFSFSAAGDLGNTTETVASLERLATSSSSFFIALGDLSYEPPGTESSWCDMVKSKVGDSYPFELLSGNHEDDARIHGWIGDFVGCLPDRLGVSGTYGANYFFDYPSGSPLVRFFLISPGLTLFNVRYEYVRGDADYNALSSRIDEARAAGIPWTIVGMHKVCISAGRPSCEIGTDLFNLLIEKRVDLILQGHDHNYQRSKQISLSPTCPEVRADGFDADCIADDGSDGHYSKGKGPVVVIDGVFGAGHSSIDPNAPDAGYFATFMGWDTPGSGFGFTRFTVTETSIQATTNFSRTFRDAFRIGAARPSAPRDLIAAPEDAAVRLSWQAPSSSGGAPVTGYTIHRGTISGILPQLIELPDLLTYRDANVTAGTTYFYRVTARNEAGEGDPSTEASATPGPLHLTAFASPVSGLVPLAVIFSSGATGGLAPYAYSWTFGDRQTSPEPSPTHLYLDAGEYVARVDVTDSQGNTAHASLLIRVLAPLAVEMSASAIRGDVPLTVSFSAAPIGGRSPYAFAWTFGDGRGSSLSHPAHTFQEPGTYLIEVTVTDADGQVSAATTQVTVTEPFHGSPGGPQGFRWPVLEMILLSLVVGATAIAAWYARIRR